MITETIDVAASAVDAALPLICQHVDDIRDHRRIPDEVVDALRHSGINRMVLPAELGGLETPTSVAMDVIERLAAVDGSTAWCAIIGAGSNIFAGYLPPDRRRRGVRRSRPQQRHDVRSARHARDQRPTARCA